MADFDPSTTSELFIILLQLASGWMRFVSKLDSSGTFVWAEELSVDHLRMTQEVPYLLDCFRKCIYHRMVYLQWRF